MYNFLEKKLFKNKELAEIFPEFFRLRRTELSLVSPTPYILYA